MPAQQQLAQRGWGLCKVCQCRCLASVEFQPPRTAPNPSQLLPAGQRYSPGSPGQPKSCQCRRLGSVFQHRRVLANCQRDDSVLLVCYNFEDSSLWKELTVQSQDVCGPPWVRFDLQVG